MNLSDFDYNLPEELIAQTPLKDRSASRFLVLNKNTGEIEHKHFRDLIDYLNKGDTLVLNDTKVIPARLIGEKTDTKAVIEVLLLKNVEGNNWEALCKPAKRVRVGTIVSFGDGLLKAKCTFVGEEGIDMGGLKKEWLRIMAESMFDPNYLLFLPTEIGQYQPI